MTEAERVLAFARPVAGDAVILDTDTYNEIDDQFALAYLFKLKKFDIRAITAAPFYNDNSSSPEDGMVKSYEEILKLFDLLGESAPVYMGSRTYLPDETTPVESPAADAIIENARSMAPGKRLYVAAIGAITNVASAILKAPDIIEKITVVWLGGHAIDWNDTKEFNLYQDVAAARVVFGCGVPLVQLPCMGVVSAFTSSKYELEHWYAGKNPLADYLCRNTVEYTDKRSGIPCWTKAIWDVTAIGWMAGEGFMRSRLIPAPIPEYDGHYAIDASRHLICYVDYIERDKLFFDLTEKITGVAPQY